MPRDLALEQQQALQILARQVTTQLELRLKIAELKEFASSKVSSSKRLAWTSSPISLTKFCSRRLAGLILIFNVIDSFLRIIELAEDEQERF